MSRPPATSTSTPITPWRTWASCSGEALAEALGDKAGIRRFASIALPLDEALVEVALDISGRPYLAYDVAFAPDVTPLGSPPFDPQLAEEFWRAFVTASGITLHLRLVTGQEHPPHRGGVVQRRRRGACATPCACEGGGVPVDQGHVGQRRRGVTMDGGIAVLDYGIGNLGSAHKAFVHLGADARLVTDPDDAAGAAGVVLPGVGAFGRCAQALRSTRASTGPWTTPSSRGVPFLGICVGFQLLYEGSEESPAVPGLGVLPGTVRALPAGGEAPADAVEPARDAPRAPTAGCWPGSPRALGVLRPLLRAGAVRRRRGDV